MVGTYSTGMMMTLGAPRWQIISFKGDDDYGDDDCDCDYYDHGGHAGD